MFHVSEKLLSLESQAEFLSFTHARRHTHTNARITGSCIVYSYEWRQLMQPNKPIPF